MVKIARCARWDWIKPPPLTKRYLQPEEKAWMCSLKYVAIPYFQSL